MLVTLDLTPRQTARVLEEALQTRAKLEIEPRPEAISALLWGSLVGRADDMLHVDLCDDGHDIELVALAGAVCDVRTMLSGQLCMFSTFVVGVSDRTTPRRVSLGVPQIVQIANRRRFARRAPTEPVPVRLTVPGFRPPFVAILSNIGPSGLACRAISRELDDALYIGDRIEIEFILPWSDRTYKLPATVCNKTPCGQEGNLIVGLEFAAPEGDKTFEHLRASLNDEAARLTGQDGAL